MNSVSQHDIRQKKLYEQQLGKIKYFIYFWMKFYQICCIGCSRNSTTFLVEQPIRNLLLTSKRDDFGFFLIECCTKKPKRSPL